MGLKFDGRYLKDGGSLENRNKQNLWYSSKDKNLKWEEVMPNWSQRNPCSNCGFKSGYPMAKCDTCGTLGCQKCIGQSRCKLCGKGKVKKI